MLRLVTTAIATVALPGALGGCGARLHHGMTAEDTARTLNGALSAGMSEIEARTALRSIGVRRDDITAAEGRLMIPAEEERRTKMTNVVPITEASSLRYLIVRKLPARTALSSEAGIGAYYFPTSVWLEFDQEGVLRRWGAVSQDWQVEGGASPPSPSASL